MYIFPSYDPTIKMHMAHDLKFELAGPNDFSGFDGGRLLRWAASLLQCLLFKPQQCSFKIARAPLQHLTD